MPFHALLADGSSTPITVEIETTTGVRLSTATDASLLAIAERVVHAAGASLVARRLVPSATGCRIAIAAPADDGLGLPLLLAYAAHALGHAHGRALPLGIAAAGVVAGTGANAAIAAVGEIDQRVQAGTLALTPGGTVVVPAGSAAALSAETRQGLEDRSLELVPVTTADEAVAALATRLLGTDTGARGFGGWLRSRFGR